MAALERNCREFGIRFADLGSDRQGIVHVIGPELGLTQPGLTIACGDSHTSTHGAFGAVAFGIGTSQVRDVLASQCLAIEPLKVRRITVTGALGPGVYAKDVILEIIARLGVKGGVGFAYEYGGAAIEGMSMDERMTVCNMSIEGGARAGYVNPDETTFRYLEGRPFAPAGRRVRAREAVVDVDGVRRRRALRRRGDHRRRRHRAAGDVGHQPRPVGGGLRAHSGSAGGRRGNEPDAEAGAGAGTGAEAGALDEALEFMGFAAGAPIAGTKVDVAFVGSCTNSRLTDLREAARVVRGQRVAPHVRALAVPGSKAIRQAAEAEGLHEVFLEAGFEWRGAGCSMCLAMNPDRLNGREVCASSSNRNFKGRQGSPTGRTLLMSPAMVAAAAVSGEVTDVRRMLG